LIEKTKVSTSLALLPSMGNTADARVWQYATVSRFTSIGLVSMGTENQLSIGYGHSMRTVSLLKFGTVYEIFVT